MNWLVTPAFAQDAPPAETHAETGAAEGHKGPFPPFDPHTFPSQIFWFVICFGVLYLMMKNVLAPRVGSIVEGRAAKIAADIGEAQRLKAEFDTALAAYEKALTEARAASHRIAQAATDEAKLAQSKQRTEIEARLAAQLVTAEARIGEIKNKALADVGAIAQDAAGAVVTALIGSEPSRDEVAGAVQAELAK